MKPTFVAKAIFVSRRGTQLGQKSCRTRVSRIFRIFRPEFCLEFCSEFTLNFEEFSCFVSWETETRKIHPKSPPAFNAKFPGKFEEKIYKSFLESRQSNT